MNISNKKVIMLTSEDVQRIVKNWVFDLNYAAKSDNISIAADIATDRDGPRFDGITIVVEENTAN